MIPQIIYIIMILISLVVSGYMHGKEKTGKYNVFIELLFMALRIGLLYWGGFFDVILK